MILNCTMLISASVGAVEEQERKKKEERRRSERRVWPVIHHPWRRRRKQLLSSVLSHAGDLHRNNPNHARGAAGVTANTEGDSYRGCHQWVTAAQVLLLDSYQIPHTASLLLVSCLQFQLQQ